MLKRINLSEEEIKICQEYGKKLNSEQEKGGKQAEFIVYNYLLDKYDEVTGPNNRVFSPDEKQLLKFYGVLLSNFDLMVGVVPVQVKSRFEKNLSSCLTYRDIKYTINSEDPIFKDPKGLVAFVLRDEVGGYVTSVIPAQEAEKYKVSDVGSSDWQLEVPNGNYKTFLLDFLKLEVKEHRPTLIKKEKAAS